MPPIKKNQLSPEDAKNLVQQYMKEQYRPYSTTDIQLNMHNILTKAKLTNILETLVSEKQLICKTIGKTSYYTYKQLIVADDIVSDDKSANDDSGLLQRKAKQLSQEIGEIKAKLLDICSTPTNQELNHALESHTSKIEKLQLELKQSQKYETVTLDPTIVLNYVIKLEKIKKQRSNTFRELIDMMSEYMETGNIIELCGIDEEEYNKFK